MKHVAPLINLALIAAVVYFGVAAGYKLVLARLTPELDRTPAATATAVTPVAPRRPPAHYAAIARRDLFNTVAPPTADTPKPADVDLNAIQETDLKLKLWGTVTGDTRQAYAVIEDLKARRQNLYRVGDSVQDALIKMIVRERVVLQVEGRNEMLQMEKLSAAGGLAAARPSALQAPARETSIRMKRAQIDNAMQDVNALMRQVRIRPHFSDGQPDGLSITGIRPNSLFRRMGLRNGDIIQGVDGQVIQSVDDALQLYNSLKSSENMALSIKRRGRERTLNYSIEP